ncbi:MAG: peptidoglycan-binding protein [Treponema sp.]|nr:peptidoglycan-binding protein [Treponema sp.]
MNCSEIIDMVYEDDGSLSFIDQVKINLHAVFCPVCAAAIERYQNAKIVMKQDFFPSSPDWSKLENSIMTKISYEDDIAESETSHTAQGVFSTRGWVIAGIILMVSLVTAFFGFDFKNIVSESGSSFLLPFGITIGIILTCYGALFIGSHLKELSERFGL